MNNIITKGFGFLASIITKGFAYVIEIITPTEKIYKRSEGGGGFLDDYFKTVNEVIKTQSVKADHLNRRIQVNVTFSQEPSIEVRAQLLKHSFENKNIELTITIL